MITDGCVVRSDSRQRKMVKTSILHINTHEIIRYSSPFVADRVLPSHSIHKKKVYTHHLSSATTNAPSRNTLSSECKL